MCSSLVVSVLVSVFHNQKKKKKKRRGLGEGEGLAVLLSGEAPRFIVQYHN